MEAIDAEQILLSLRPEVNVSSTPQGPIENEVKEDSIASLLHLIGRQRGSFRNFTEASLLAEIAGTSSSAVVGEHETTEESTMVPMETSDETAIAPVEIKDDETPVIVDKANNAKIRDDFYRLVGVALNEAALALDFTSLLLSATRPTAVQSMSPALKEAVSVGSLSHVHVHRAAPKQDPNAHTSVLGFRMQGLNAASAALKRASEETGQQVGHEIVFWSEIQTLLEYGWPIFRLKAGVTGLALRFSPAQNHYIPLVMDSDGHVDVTNLSMKNSRIRFSLCKNDTDRTLASLIDPPEAAKDEDSEQEPDADGLPQIIQTLRRMRKSLRASTMFGGLVRESRELASHGLTVNDGRIRIPIYNGTDVLIELVDYQDTTEDVTMNDDVDQPSDNDLFLLTTLKTFIHYSTGIGKPPLRTFLTSYAHEVSRADVQTRLTKIIEGLGRQSWSLAAPTLITETTADADPPSSNFVITCITTEITFTIGAFAPTNVRFSVVVSTPSSANGGSTTTTTASLPRMIKKLRTQSKKKAIEYCMQQMLDSIIRYLVACDSRVTRCGETEVRVGGLMLTITLTDDGEFRLASADGTVEKYVRAGDDLVNVVVTSC